MKLADLKFKAYVWAMQHIRVFKALRYLKHLEDFAAKHPATETFPGGYRGASEGRAGESVMSFFERMHYHQGHLDGEQHVGIHAYWWSGGQDEDFKYEAGALHDHLSQRSSALDDAAVCIQSMLTQCNTESFRLAQEFIKSYEAMSAIAEEPAVAE